MLKVKDLVRRVADETGIGWNDVVSIIYAMTDYITEKAAEGHPIAIREFGEFKLTHTREFLASKYMGPEYRWTCGFTEGQRLKQRLR